METGTGSARYYGAAIVGNDLPDVLIAGRPAPADASKR
jgi:hypothetical protein